jgi:hypothetical protein
LLLGELAQSTEELLGITAAEREEASAAALHAAIVGAGDARPYSSGTR